MRDESKLKCCTVSTDYAFNMWYNNRAVVLGRMRSELRERPAVYPAFALRATRESSSLEDQMSSFSTDDVDVWCYAAVCCMPETTTTLSSEVGRKCVRCVCYRMLCQFSADSVLLRKSLCRRRWATVKQFIIRGRTSSSRTSSLKSQSL